VLPKSKVLAVAALLAGSSAYATTVYGDFANIGANKWTGSFVVVNDGSLAELSNFTVYFDQAYANNLVLLQSPATWDTIVIEPDLPLSSNGFLDGLAIALADVLKPGERIGEFSVGFDWEFGKWSTQELCLRHLQQWADIIGKRLNNTFGSCP